MTVKKRPPPVDAPAGPFNAAFAKLSGMLPEGHPAPSPGASAVSPAPKGPARAVVRIERKGRGGKEATVVDKLGLPPKLLGGWADDAKRALGCGGAVEGDAIVLQGDQRDRVARWLEARGVRKVTVA